MMVILLTVSLLVGSIAPAAAVILSEQEISAAMTRIEQRDDKGLETVLKNQEGAPSYLLFMASKYASTQDRLGDAAFLFYVGLLRYEVDLAAYRMAEDDDQPAILVSIAVSELGRELLPQLMAKPDLYGMVLDRLEKWAPSVSSEYNPGWASQPFSATDQLEGIVSRVKGEILAIPRNLAVLLRHPIYFANLRTILANLGESRLGVVQAKEVEHAERLLTDMERERRLPALYDRRSKRTGN